MSMNIEDQLLAAAQEAEMKKQEKLSPAELAHLRMIDEGAKWLHSRMNRVDHDPVNMPQHYRAGDIYETIRVIEAWRLGFNLGNTVKYISRAGEKGDRLEDLKKARWYLDREIALTEGANGKL